MSSDRPARVQQQLRLYDIRWSSSMRAPKVTAVEVIIRPRVVRR